MIRRHVGHELWLFTQDDHAKLSGELARHLGGLVHPLSPITIGAIGAHDRGWIAADAVPALNAAGQPGDVFENDLSRGMEIWRQSTVLAHQELGDYAGLLVSCHGLALSAFAASHTFSQERPGSPDLRLHFLINKFQHAEVEFQEQMRSRLGMRLDIPLHLGLATDSIEPAEQRLIYDYRWLSAMDQLSLDICCTNVMFPAITHIAAAPGAADFQLHIARIDHHQMCVRPWPFRAERIRVSINYRRLPDRTFSDSQDLKLLLDSTEPNSLEVELFPASPLAATA